MSQSELQKKKKKRRRDKSDETKADQHARACHFKHLELRARFGLLPHSLDDVRVHIFQLLQAGLMKYHAALGGVPISLSAIRLAPGHEYGRIRFSDPRVYVTVRLAARVFCPAPGRRLVGRVSKVEPAFVGLLVHGLFNASIAAADMPGFTYDEADDVWRDETSSSSPKHTQPQVVRLGSYVVFRLVRSHHARGVLAMDGALVRVLNDDDVVKDALVSSSSSSRRLDDAGDRDGNRDNVTTVDTTTSATTKEPAASQRRANGASSRRDDGVSSRGNNGGDSVDGGAPSPTKKKQKKKSKRKHEES